MIGTSRVRSRCLISAAVSKPSMPGIWTSSRITAKSCVEQRSRSACSPESASTTLDAERLEHGLQREQVLRPVVDEQDAGAAGSDLAISRCSQTRMSDSSWSTSTGLVT